MKRGHKGVELLALHGVLHRQRARDHGVWVVPPLGVCQRGVRLLHSCAELPAQSTQRDLKGVHLADALCERGDTCLDARTMGSSPLRRERRFFHACAPDQLGYCCVV